MKLKGGSVKHDHRQQLFCVMKLNDLMHRERKQGHLTENRRDKKREWRQDCSRDNTSRKDKYEYENEDGVYTQSPETLVIAVSMERKRQKSKLKWLQ